MGGLVAKGDDTAAGKPNAALEGPRLKPRLGRFAVGGGLVAEPDGVGGVGAVPLLNSAQRGHFRFVSIKKNAPCSATAYCGKPAYSCAPSDHNDHTASVGDATC